MDINNNFHLEEELFRSKGGREFAGEWSFDTLQENAAKQTRKRPRELAVKTEGMKKTGVQGKSGQGTGRGG